MLPGIWKEFLEIVREEVGNQVVETWLKAVVFIRWDALEKTAYIQAPNTFVRDWVRTNYHNLFILHLGRLLNIQSIKVHFFIEKELSKSSSITAVALEPSVEKTSIVPGKLPSINESKVPAVSRKLPSLINPNYNFENFVIGPSNSLAHAAAVAVAEKPGILYNPLFIYGSSGLGKTHLLHAIANRVKDEWPARKVMYQNADRFVNEFISAIRFNRMFQFREKYKLVDVLLIDDIQFIASKDQTQEVFFHIFNSLYESHRQIVLSGDCYPKDLKGISERLRSRMEWGLVADIYVPTIEMKVAILKRKAEQNQVFVSDEVAQLIANRASTNIRQLEGNLVRVIAFAHLTGQTISASLVERVLGTVAETVPNSISFDKIVQTVASNYSYTIEQLRSQERGRDLAFVRQIAMFLMKELTNRPLREIGLFLGRKDHSTVLHAVQKIAHVSRINSKLQQELATFRKELGFS